MPTKLTTLALAALAIPVPPHALPVSDQVGVYALIDKVTFHPAKKAPQQVEVAGAFAVAEAKHGNYYRSARWGSVRFLLDKKNVDKCRAQWADLAKVAGTGKCVGFGFRYRQQNLRVSRAGAKKIAPTVFETGMGVRKVRNADYGPVRQLRCLPKPHSPVMGEAVRCQGGYRPEQPIAFTVDNCLDESDDLRYVFEFERADGDIRASEPIPAGDQRTTWNTKILLTPGEIVTWRVRVIRKGLSVASVARASFVAGAAKKELR